MTSRRVAWLVAAVCASGCGSEGEEAATTVAEVVGERLTAQELRSSVKAEWTESQDYIAECMRAQGFEYIAWLDPATLPQIPNPEVQSLSDREFAQQYGFGISTRTPEPREAVTNPNGEYYEGLSNEVQDAYDLALSGVVTGDHLAIVEVSGATSGADNCEQFAYDHMAPVDGPSEAIMQSYRELLAEIDDRTFADPRVLEQGDAGTRCLRDLGYDVTTDLAIIDQFLLEAEALTGIEYVSLEAMEGLLTDEKILEIQTYERSFATATHDCFEAMESIAEIVRAEIEKEVVQDNYSTFVAAAAGLRQNRAD